VYADSPRVALAVLHSDISLEPELRELLPYDVAVYANRVAYPPEVTAANLREAVDGLQRCVSELAAVRPQVVVGGCTSGWVLGHPAAHAELLERLRTWSGGAVPVTAAGAVVGALERREVRRVAVATPYPPEVRDLLLARLEEAGYEVVASVDAFDEPVDDWTLQSLDEQEIAALARRADHPEAEAVVVSCTGLAGGRVAGLVGADLGKPVLTSNVAIAEAVGHALLEDVPAR
jgi:maleate isomerase